jgi:hypothetical protein
MDRASVPVFLLPELCKLKKIADLEEEIRFSSLFFRGDGV